MKLTDLKLSDYKTEKDFSDCGIYSRVTYFDPVCKKYIKVWNKNYFYKKYFDLVCHSNLKFFDDISLLEDIIEDDDGNIVGYVTPEAKTVDYNTLDTGLYNDLIDRLAEKSNHYGIVYLDLRLRNVVVYNKKYYIIDLEPSIPFRLLGEINQLKFMLQHNNFFYLKKIKSLLSKVISVNESFSVVKLQTSWSKEIKYGTANGRLYLEHEYLPSLKGKTLFVGVNYYTNFYHLLPSSLEAQESFETLDCIEERISDGSPNTHYVCNILDFQNQGYLYDDVCCFGVLGHDDDWEVLRNKEEIVKCITLLDEQVKPGGTLLLGPANQSFSFDWWDEIYKLPVLKKYTQLMLKKIDINYVWYGRKNA